MTKEIERKFLVKSNNWKNNITGKIYRQGYLSTTKEKTVRIRTIAEDTAFLTIKGITIRNTRDEYEYKIPIKDANEMLDKMCEGCIVEKRRYKIEHKCLTWEIDEFYSDNYGLIIAEVELNSEDQRIELPPWIGIEVSNDARYYNSNLAKNPYRNWKQNEDI